MPSSADSSDGKGRVDELTRALCRCARARHTHRRGTHPPTPHGTHTPTHPGGLKLCLARLRDALEEGLHAGPQHVHFGAQLCRVAQALGIGRRDLGIVLCHKGRGLCIEASEQRVQLGALGLAHGAREVVHALGLLNAALLLLLCHAPALFIGLLLQLGQVQAGLGSLGQLGHVLRQQVLVVLGKLDHLVQLDLLLNARSLLLHALLGLLLGQLLLPQVPRQLLVAGLALLLWAQCCGVGGVGVEEGERGVTGGGGRVLCRELYGAASVEKTAMGPSNVPPPLRGLLSQVIIKKRKRARLE
jgi:hypothetical protein